MLGTASQVPTRQRNQNGYLLRWDGEGFLFDPGEGAQRQMLLAGVAATDITRICLTHFHGDHVLGLPGVVQRLSLDNVPHPVTAYFPASGARYFANLRHASAFYQTAQLHETPISGDGPIATTTSGQLSARRLDHSIESYGFRLAEPDGRRMLPGRLAAYQIYGPSIGRLQRTGWLDHGGRRITLEEVSEPRRGQVFAFVMDTRECRAAYQLAEDADLLVIEATFLSRDEPLAQRYGHLTAAAAGRIAAESGVRRLVLTHFSQRYDDPRRFADEAAAVFAGEIVVARDLDRVPVRSGEGA